MITTLFVTKKSSTEMVTISVDKFPMNNGVESRERVAYFASFWTSVDSNGSLSQTFLRYLRGTFTSRAGGSKKVRRGGEAIILLKTRPPNPGTRTGLYCKGQVCKSNLGLHDYGWVYILPSTARRGSRAMPAGPDTGEVELRA